MSEALEEAGKKSTMCLDVGVCGREREGRKEGGREREHVSPRVSHTNELTCGSPRRYVCLDEKGLKGYSQLEVRVQEEYDNKAQGAV